MGLFSKEQPIDLTKIKESMVHRIAYVGMERGDLLIALVKVALSSGLRVALADNSVTHDIFDIYKNEDEEDESIIDRGQLTIIRNAVLDEAQHGYDLIIEYLGANEPVDTDAKVLFMVTDAKKSNITAVKGYITAPFHKRLIVYRDTSADYSASDLTHDLGLQKTDTVNSIKYDRKEMEAYYRLTREPSSKFTYSFGSCALTFEEMCRIMYGDSVTDKQLKDLIKKGAGLTL